MFKVLLVIHVMVAIALIIIVLVQRTSSDGMGLSGSSSSNNFLSGRMAANFMTRATALLATAFILTSLGLGIITARNHTTGSSLLDKIQAAPVAPAPAAPDTPGNVPATPDANAATGTAPATTPAAPAATTEKPAAPATPAVPRPE